MGTSYRHSVSHSWHIIHYGRTISTTTDDNNSKSTIPEDSDEKHYYYGYSIPRQLIYSGSRIFIPGSVDSSTALAMDLPLLLAMAE